MAFVDVQAPLPEVVVHLHREDGEVLVKVDVDGVSGVELGVIIDDVALGLGQPVWAHHLAGALPNDDKQNTLHHLVRECHPRAATVLNGQRILKV